MAQLHSHHNIHMEEKAFQMWESKQDSFRTHLIKHKRTHSAEQPYPCTNCRRNFSTHSGYHSPPNLHVDREPCAVIVTLAITWSWSYLWPRCKSSSHLVLSYLSNGISVWGICQKCISVVLLCIVSSVPRLRWVQEEYFIHNENTPITCL